MNLGLLPEQIQQIVGVIKESGASKALVFGSRAKGNWRENSDIDIAILGREINVAKLSALLDELPMPYQFDVVDYENINATALREHIDRVGIAIYESNDNMFL